jgi:ATP-dependent DNA helicase DinG
MIGLHDSTGVPPKPQRARALAAAIFGEAGWLHGGMDLEYRPEQDQMARAVAAAFSDDASLLFEAGTGVGKSLAYLVPGIIHAVDTGRPLIVSTHTISLQEQLETKDLPLCRSLFSSVPELEGYASFKSAVLLGKSNYLCTSRLAHALSERANLFDDGEYAELQRIAAWSDATPSGLRHEMQPPPRAEVWEAVNADSSSCSRRHCDPATCFYQRARSRIRAANLIIVNHALLFALINAGGARAEAASAEGRGVLFPDDFVVLDEAHTIPEVATDHFGIALSSYGVDRSLKVLYNPRTKRGLLRKLGGLEAQRLVAEALDCAKQFFGLVEAKLLASRPVARKREAELVDPLMDGPLDALQRHVARVADQLEEGRERDELLEQKGRLKAIQAGAGEWLNLSNPEHVYWAERSGRRQTIVTLRSAPIDVAPELRRHLFGCGVGVVCTSATLALAGEMAPFAGRIGAVDVRTGLVHSPFDFERNMRVYVAADVPPPSPQEARLSLEALADYISFCALRVPGGSLVLFTSHADLREIAAMVEADVAKAGRRLLMQGEGASRTELARQMRSLGNAILFGTDSFWTGVDVPGDALAQVVITRLPFDPPDHPVTEARADRIRDNGGNPFNEMTLPDALVKFRQGAGRLIRSRTDRGLITILDSRILSKAYGRLFIESLPQQEFHRLTRDNREELFRPYPLA